jgi:hypothetical protein
MEQSHNKNDGNDKKIKVIVTYTGSDDFVDEFPQSVPLSTIKTKALHKFGIEASQSAKYALEDDSGARPKETTKLSEFDSDPVKFALVFVKDQTKG